jgi:hypothetical protein
MEHNPPCWNCKHIMAHTGATCAAFPKGIPDVIWEGHFDHESPLGDEKDGLIFEADDKRIGNPTHIRRKRPPKPADEV